MARPRDFWISRPKQSSRQLDGLKRTLAQHRTILYLHTIGSGRDRSIFRGWGEVGRKSCDGHRQ